MSIKHTLLALLIALLAGLHAAIATETVAANVESTEASDEPVQHLQLPDINSYDESKDVFVKTTSELQEKDKLDSVELNDIHIITYSLEKAVAYFVENMEGEQQTAAAKMAEVVELVHKASENNRPAETKLYLEQYFERAQAFSSKL